MKKEGANSPEELKEALFSHAFEWATKTKIKLGGPLTGDNLPVLLTSPGCLRYPTVVQFDRKNMEPQQFAQPEILTSENGPLCRLHVDPEIQSSNSSLYLIVAYMAASINYGDTATPDLAEMVGSMLTGMPVEDFYNSICQIADSLELKNKTLYPHVIYSA